MISTFIIMPVANEEASIKHTIEKISVLNIPGLTIVTVMDDHSKDNTKDIIAEMEKDHPVRLLYYKESKGVVSCYLKGFQYALEHNADYIIEMDAGGSHAPEMIPKFITALQDGHDCVFASRFMKGGEFRNVPFLRRAVSKYGTFLANFILGTKLSDMTSGFEGFNSNVLKSIDLNNILSLSTTHFLQTELRYYCRDLRFCEIPIVYTGSESSFKVSDVTKSLAKLFQLKKRAPLKPFNYL